MTIPKISDTEASCSFKSALKELMRFYAFMHQANFGISG